MKTLRIENRWNKESSNFAIVSFQTFKLQQSLHALHVLQPPQPPPKPTCQKRVQAQDYYFALTLVNVYSAIIFYIILGCYLHLFFCMYQEHRQTHGTTREPLLENITSDYDLELFRKAQARAAEDLVWTDMSHFCNSTKTSPFSFIPSNCK